jgi:hypothetical protein
MFGSCDSSEGIVPEKKLESNRKNVKLTKIAINKQAFAQ